MRPRLAQLHQSGATDGQLAAWNDTLGLWEPIDPAAVVDSAGDLTTAFMPLTTVVAGVPELVWDADDSLIPTEVPL